MIHVVILLLLDRAYSMLPKEALQAKALCSWNRTRPRVLGLSFMIKGCWSCSSQSQHQPSKDLHNRARSCEINDSQLKRPRGSATLALFWCFFYKMSWLAGTMVHMYNLPSTISMHVQVHSDLCTLSTKVCWKLYTGKCTCLNVLRELPWLGTLHYQSCQSRELREVPSAIVLIKSV